MASQVILDQIREIELFIDVWETQESGTPLSIVEKQDQLQKPDEELPKDIICSQKNDPKQGMIEKPTEYVPTDTLIKEKEITHEIYVPDEKEPDPAVLENNLRDKPVPDASMIPDEVISSKIELLEQERICEEKIAEEADKETEKTIDSQLIVSNISLSYELNKPEEKMIEREHEKKKGILRKAVLDNYRNVCEDKEKVLIEQQMNALPSPSSSSRSVHILPDRSMISIKDVYASPVRTDPGILSRQSSRKDNMSDTTSISIKSLSTRSFLNEQPMQPSSRPVTQSRRGSTSSKKSSQSIKSARRHNEKKLSQAAQKYIPRTYEEMMRIPDVYERIVFYEKTLDLCLKTESPITNWTQFMSTRGKPKALEEGYVPTLRSDSPEPSTFSSSSTSLSGSISTFLKKAAGSQAFTRRNTTMDKRSFLTPSQSAYGSGLFQRSISRLSLSRSTQIPKYDQYKTPNQRVNALNKRSPNSKRGSIGVTNTAFINQMDIPKSSISMPQSFDTSPASPCREQSAELDYLMGVFPHEDVRTLLEALNEANGDPMSAITIVINK